MYLRGLRSILAVTAIAAGLGLTGNGSPAAAAEEDGSNVELTGAQRAVIREATKRFRNVDAAIAAGYLPTEDCVELPGVGGMATTT